MQAAASITLFTVEVVVALLSTLIIKARLFRYEFTNGPTEQIPLKIKEQFLIGSGGLLAIGAGYIPIITVIPPALEYSLSRGNILPSMGAALTISVFLVVAVRLFGFKGRLASQVFAFLAIPLVVLGFATQLMAQKDTNNGWREQKRIWQQLFNLAPDLRPDTFLLLVLPEYPDHMGAKPFQDGNPAFSTALSLMYGHAGLRGQYVYGDVISPCAQSQSACTWFNENGFSIFSADPFIVPYPNILLLQYNRETGFLEKLTKLSLMMEDGLQQSKNLCSNCTSSRHSRRTELRWLVE